MRESALIPTKLFRRVSGLDKPALHYLMRNGFRPAVSAPRSGRGHTHLFTRTQLIAALVVRALRARDEKLSQCDALGTFLWNFPTEHMEQALAKGRTWCCVVGDEVIPRLMTAADIRRAGQSIDLAVEHGISVLYADLSTIDALVRERLADPTATGECPVEADEVTDLDEQEVRR